VDPRALRLGVIVSLLGGCSTAPAPPPEDAAPAPTETADAPPAKVGEPPPSAVAPSAPSPSSAPAPTPAACASDGECRWNDGCFPTACVLGKPQPRACDESAPEPGTCRCRAGRCALVYKGTTGRCTRDADCTWDDPCNPTVCSLGKPPAFVGCDKSRPAPGQCLCVDHACASVTP